MLARTAHDVGSIVRARRRGAGLTQSELASRVGASRKWVSDLENGHPGAELGRVLAVLEAVGALVDVKPKPLDDELTLGRQTWAAFRADGPTPPEPLDDALRHTYPEALLASLETMQRRLIAARTEASRVADAGTERGQAQRGQRASGDHPSGSNRAGNR